MWEGSTMRGYARLFALCITLLAILIPQQAAAAYRLSTGGCFGDAQYTPAQLMDPVQNRRASSFLRSVGCPVAGLGGFVSGRQLFWNNGEPISWFPNSLNVDSPDFSGFIALQDNGLWSAKPFDDYSHTEFLCMNGTYSDSVSSSINSPVVPTQEPPSTNVPTTTTTTVTTVEPTSSPQPTTFSLELTITLMHMALNMLGKIDVVEYTANALVLPLSAEVKRSVQQLLQEGVVIRLGFGLGSVPSSYAALLQSKTSRTALEFVLPWEVLSADSSAVFHIFLVVRKFHDSDSTIPSISPVVTTCTIHVHSFVDVLVNLNEDLMLWGEDEPQQLEDPSNHSIGLTLFGEPSTLAPFTTDVSPIAWESIDLYLVNHGRPGGHCIASTTSISFAMVHHRLYLSIPQSLRLRVHAARKSMCAVVRGKRSGIVVAILGLQSFQATTTQAVWNVEELLPVRMSGITFFSVVAGRVGAFLSNSPKCTTNTSAAALIVASSSDRLSPWAFIRATSEVVGGAAYVCLRTRILSVPVRDADGIPARFTPPTISALEDEPQTVPEVLLLRGLLGSINLVEYVERSPEDINVEGTIHNLVSDSSLRHIRCVVVAPDASTEERQSQCVEQTDSIDTFPLVKGIATVDHPINFTGHGIFCLGEHYVGITYTSTPIADWVKSFESHTVEATGTIADVLLVGDQLSAVLMQIQGPLVPFLSLRLSTDACLSGYTTSLENYTSNQLVAVLPHNLAGLYQLCVGLQTAHGTAAFAPLTITTRLISYARAWEFWITAKDEERWRPCGPTAVCEVSPEPSYVRLCSVSGAFEQGRRIWPRKLETQLNYRGGFHVLGVNHLVSAVVLDGEVFARLEDVSMEITCVKHLQLELSTDGVVYGTHAIMSPLNPTTWIDAPWQYRGAVVRFVDAELESWNASPNAHSAPLMISQSGTQVLIDGTLNVMNRTSTAYVRLCYLIRSHDWRSIDGDVLTLSPYASGLSEVRVEALGVPGALSVIDLYATQVTRWRLEGIFDASMHAALYFIPAAQSCIYTTATNAVFHAPITYEGSSSAVVDIDVSHIDVQLEGEESARLRACYSLSPGRGKLLPLGAEEEQERDIVVHGLSLESINLQASCRVECQPQSSTISLFLSPTSLGENDAPIAQLMLLEGESTTDAQCVRSAPQFIAVVPVHHHPRWGFRTVEFPLSVLPTRCPAQVHFCASVDDSANASFKPIQAYLNFGDEGPSELCASPVVLLLAHYVQQVNAYETEDETPPNALRSFIASRTSVPAESIRMMSLQPNTIAVAVNQPGGLQEVYDVMATHTLPLLSTHDADLSFSAVEGVEWPSLRPAADFPIILLNSGAESKSTTPWTTWLLRASCLAAVVFCVIMAAVAVCRPMPSFTDRLETSPQALRRTPTAARNFVIEGNSPPPRDPQAARDYLDAKERMTPPAVLFHSRWEEEVEQSGTLQRAEE